MTPRAAEAPPVLVVTRRMIRKNRSIDYVAELHLELLIRLKLLPVMVPVVPGTVARLAQYARGMRGLVLVEGEDIEPERYAAKPVNREHLEDTHPERDEIEIRLVRLALKRSIPILGICRGSEIVNVTCGGTLFVDVQHDNRSALPHIDYDNYDTYRHSLSIVPGTPLARWYSDPTIRVNSYHHQGIRRLAPRLRSMAQAEDGLIEAFYDPRARFLVGLQFHPERMLEEHPGNLRVWQAFSAAVRKSA
ncbi:MAG TPA: gamma-glutamyl-gamma-aminobutyrate hydrolase family protein [Gemmatimonadales bacterium]|nr:gamma-glutamyl-gamma-aminobutyrate hydrolase family protein [Gemmatimonadales bacterium]